jgi:hypothetical protein
VRADNDGSPDTNLIESSLTAQGHSIVPENNRIVDGL